MKTVQEVSRLTGVSIRTLHYYDDIGLLKPSQVTAAGYRLYDGTALARLQGILLFRELKFPLKDIRAMLDTPDFDQKTALEQQIHLLELQQSHICALIAFARDLQKTGGTNTMDFSAFDTTEMDRYAAEAKARWGKSEAWQEYEEKAGGQGALQQKQAADGLMAIFARLGQLAEQPPESAPVQALIGELQAYITAHYYTCTPQILRGLGAMYAAGGEMTENIDAAGGAGTAVLAQRAIEVYCGA